MTFNTELQSGEPSPNVAAAAATSSVAAAAVWVFVMRPGLLWFDLPGKWSHVGNSVTEAVICK